MLSPDARVVKLVDTRVLEARAVRCVGSSPIPGTNSQEKIKRRPQKGRLFIFSGEEVPRSSDLSLRSRRLFEPPQAPLYAPHENAPLARFPAGTTIPGTTSTG